MILGESEGTSENIVFKQTIQSIFELAVSPGVANKKFTPKMMITLSEIVGEEGMMEYTPDHMIKLQILTSEPEVIVRKIEGSQLFNFSGWGCSNSKSL